ncbi:MAG: type II secretion system F family protein [Candidatus Bathyarchaeota archaeon]|nr:type II secretion system F family protein [Candidatus Bathyarchaeota archaeon]
MVKKLDSHKGSPFSFHELGYRVLGVAPARFFPWSEKLRQSLLRASVKVNHVVYVSSMFFWSLITFVVSLVIVPVLFVVFSSLVGVVFPLSFIVVIGLLAGGVSFGVCFVVFLSYPSYKASVLKMKIEKNLVYVANYMAILSGSGATPGETFGSLARIGEVFNLKESAQSVVRSVELLGDDLIAALDAESKRTPSKDYSNFLQGYISTIQTGGNLHFYLMTMANKFTETRRRRLSKMISQLGLAGELYITVLVAFPIIMITLLVIMGVFGGEVIGGLSAAQIMPLLVYLLLPAAALFVLVYVDAILSSW